MLVAKFRLENFNLTIPFKMWPREQRFDLQFSEKDLDIFRLQRFPNLHLNLYFDLGL